MRQLGTVEKSPEGLSVNLGPGEPLPEGSP